MSISMYTFFGRTLVRNSHTITKLRQNTNLWDLGTTINIGTRRLYPSVVVSPLKSFI